MRRGLTAKEYERLHNLRAFMRWFGLPRIERDLNRKGMYFLYYPGEEGEDYKQWGSLEYLNGWLYGVVQAFMLADFKKGFDRNGHTEEEVLLLTGREE